MGSLEKLVAAQRFLRGVKPSVVADSFCLELDGRTVHFANYVKKATWSQIRVMLKKKSQQDLNKDVEILQSWLSTPWRLTSQRARKGVSSGGGGESPCGINLGSGVTRADFEKLLTNAAAMGAQQVLDKSRREKPQLMIADGTVDHLNGLRKQLDQLANIKERAVCMYLKDNKSDVEDMSARKYFAELESAERQRLEELAVQELVKEPSDDLLDLAAELFTIDHEYKIEERAIEKFLGEHVAEIEEAAINQYIEDNEAVVEEVALKRYMKRLDFVSNLTAEMESDDEEIFLQKAKIILRKRRRLS